MSLEKTNGGNICMIPKICILRSDGTNWDFELAYAFEKAGGKAEFVHINQLRSKEINLDSFQALALPGGFSYGDDIASGKILAVEMVSSLKAELEKFRGKEGVIIGICNGFQTLIRSGLLPFGNLGALDATPAPNDDIVLLVYETEKLFAFKTTMLAIPLTEAPDGNTFTL